MSNIKSFIDEVHDFIQDYLENAYKKFRKMNEIEEEQFNLLIIWLQKVTQNDITDFIEEDKNNEKSNDI